MSHHEYEASKIIGQNDFPFYAIIMAAMRQADTGNYALLKRSFPETEHELRVRYNLPGGKTPSEWEAHLLTVEGNTDEV